MSPLSRRSLLATSAAAGLGLSAALSGPLAFAAPPPPGRNGPARALGDAESDILYTTSFETDESPWMTTSTSYVTDQVRTGARSLRYERTDPANYVLPAIALPAVAGERYEAIVHTRTEGLTGAYNRGARIGLDAIDAAGKWVEGAYSGSTRATDWHKSRTLYTASDGVVGMKISVHIYKGLTGTAWFEDLVVRRLPPIVLSTELVQPGYRGLLVPGDHDSAILRSRVLLEDPTGHTLTLRVLDAAGLVLDETTVAAASVVEHEFDFADRAAGRYGLAVELVDPQGVAIADEQWGIERATTAPGTWVDRHGRFIRDGAVSLPIGFYNRIDQETVDALQGTVFTTLLSYDPPDQAGLDLAQSAGLSVIYSLKDFFYDSAQGAKPAEIVHEEDEIPTIIDRVTRYRDHPAMLAWYMADEPYEDQLDRLVTHYRAVADNDPDHPAYIVVNASPEPAGVFMRSTDIIGIDSYPVRGVAGEAIDQPTQRAREAADQLPNRGRWHAPQAFGWAAYDATKPEQRFPTVEELRNMTWQFLCQGALGLIYYSLKDLRNDPTLPFAEAFGRVEQIATEVVDHQANLTSVEPDPVVVVPDEAWLGHLVGTIGSLSHLHLVNTAKAAHSVTIEVAAAVAVRRQGSDQPVPVDQDGAFVIGLASLAVEHLEIDLVTFERLAEATRNGMVDPSVGRGRAAAERSVTWLDRARAADRRGDQLATEAALQEYRELIGELGADLLPAVQATRLVRLSRHLG